MAQVQLSDMSGVVLQTSVAHNDLRGTFTKYYDQSSTNLGELDFRLKSLSIATNIKIGTLRGLHFQLSPFEEEKVIVCLSGKIYDVIVDLRSGSPTEGKWASIELGSDQPSSLRLPKGFAHGYQTLTSNASVLYGLSSVYRPEKAVSLLFNDVELNISWPLPVSNISPKDAQGISLDQALAATREALK